MKTRLLFLFLSFLCLTSSFCQSVGDVIYSTQEQVNNNTPTGDFEFKRIIFEGEDIVDLSPILGLITDCKELVIRNTSLTDLSGLDSLIYAYGITSQIQQSIFRVNGELTILDNPLLENLDGIQNLRKTTNVTIKNNPNLKNTNALSINSYGIDAWGDGTGFNEQLDPSIIIEDNDNLEFLAGFDSLVNASNLRISNNPKLNDLATFHNLEGVIGVESFDYIGHLEILGNSSLVDLKGLENVSNALKVVIDGNENLKSCQGLGNCLLRSFTVRNNPALEKLGTFSLNLDRYVLDTSPMVFTISNNPQLHSIELDSVLFGSVGYNDELWITITENESLETCSVGYICQSFGLDSMFVEHNFFNNNEGCNYLDQVFEQCGVKETVFIGRLGIDDSCSFLFDEENSFDNVRIRDSLSGQLLARSDLKGVFSFSLINVAFDSVLVQAENIGNLLGPFESLFKIYNTDTIPDPDTIGFNYCPDYFSDLSASIENVDPFLEIGSETSYTLCYTNNGTIIDTATLFFEYEDINEIEAYLEYLEIDGGVFNDFKLSWDILDLAPLETECKNITVKIPDDFPLGDSLKYKLSIQSVSNFDIKNQEDNSTRGTQEVGIGDLMVEVFAVVSRCNIDYKIWISNTSDFAHQTDLLFRKTDASMNGKFEYTSIDGASMQGDSLLLQTPLMQPGVRDTFEVSLRINKNIAKDEDIIMTVEMLGVDNDLSNNKVEKENSVTTFGTTLNIFSQSDADNCPCIHVVNDLVKVRDDNGIINNLDSLLNLEVINGKLSIGPVGGFQDLEGLSNLRQLSSLEVFESDIISINGLEQISTLNGIKILTNNNLIDLSGLENVETLNNDLWIRYNDALESIIGLQPTSHNIDILKIDYNPLLEFCESDFICALMAVGEISKSVVGNNGECTEEETLLEACGILSLEDQSHLKQISVFPNPASNRIHLQSNTPLDDFDISLKNLDGKTLHKLAADSSTLDVSDYPSGLYLITIESEGTRVVKKIVIN